MTSKIAILGWALGILAGEAGDSIHPQLLADCAMPPGTDLYSHANRELGELRRILATRSGVILAAGGRCSTTNCEAVIRRSVNGGESWDAFVWDSPRSQGPVVEIMGEDGAGRIYAVARYDESWVVSRSLDDGLAWETVDHFDLRRAIQSDITFSDRLVAGTLGNSPNEFWYTGYISTEPSLAILRRTSDGGENWETISVIELSKHTNEMAWGLAVLPSGTLVWGTRGEQRFSETGSRLGYPTILRRSIDGGINWETNELGLHAAVGRRMALGSDGVYIIVDEWNDNNRNGRDGEALFYLGKEDGQAWDAVGCLGENEVGETRLRDLSVSPAGVMTVAATTSASREGMSWVTTAILQSRDRGLSWCVVERLTTSGHVTSGARFVSLDCDASGNVVLGYSGRDSKNESVPWLIRKYPATDARPPLRFLRGDCNSDGQVAGQISDAVFLLRFNFGGGSAPDCLAACDANGDGVVEGELSDAVYLLIYNFRSGPPPEAPYPGCGLGRLSTDTDLGCEASPTCR